MPAPAELRALIDRYAAAVTAGDVDAVADLFTDDAVQSDPVTAPPNVGREAIRAFFRAAADASTATRFEAVRVHTAGDRAAVDFRVTVTLASGIMTIEGIEVFTVADDGRIRAVEAYWDDADVTVAGS